MSEYKVKDQCRECGKFFTSELPDGHKCGVVLSRYEHDKRWVEGAKRRRIVTDCRTTGLAYHQLIEIGFAMVNPENS